MEAALEHAARTAGVGPDGELEFCAQCEMPLQPGAAFCAACGTAVAATTNASGPRSPPASRAATGEETVTVPRTPSRGRGARRRGATATRRARPNRPRRGGAGMSEPQGQRPGQGQPPVPAGLPAAAGPGLQQPGQQGYPQQPAQQGYPPQPGPAGRLPAAGLPASRATRGSRRATRSRATRRRATRSRAATRRVSPARAATRRRARAGSRATGRRAAGGPPKKKSPLLIIGIVVAAVVALVAIGGIVIGLELGQQGRPATRRSRPSPQTPPPDEPSTDPARRLAEQRALGRLDARRRRRVGGRPSTSATTSPWCRPTGWDVKKQTDVARPAERRQERLHRPDRRARRRAPTRARSARRGTSSWPRARAAASSPTPKTADVGTDKLKAATCSAQITASSGQGSSALLLVSVVSVRSSDGVTVVGTVAFTAGVGPGPAAEGLHVDDEQHAADAGRRLTGRAGPAPGPARSLTAGAVAATDRQNCRRACVGSTHASDHRPAAHGRPLQDGGGLRAVGRPADRHRRPRAADPSPASRTSCCSARPAPARPRRSAG